MKKYTTFFRIRFLGGMQYRAAALAGVATQFAWGVMNILLYRAFYRADPSAVPMAFSQLTSYLWLQQAFLALFMPWFFENDIFDAITSGGVAYELARPADLYGMWFCRGIAGRCSRAALRCLPVLAVAALLPEPWGLSPPASPAAAVLFPLSCLLGTTTVTALCMLLYVLTFHTLSPKGPRAVFVSVSDLLAGGILPLVFLPDGVRQVVEALPFASVQNVPLRIYVGDLAGSEALARLWLQLFWTAALSLLGWGLLRGALRRVVAQGG